MRKRPLGNTGLSVSELGLGTWGLSGDGYAPVADSEQDSVIDRARALGVTLFETADSYGKGAMEKKLGERLSDDKDNPVVIVTKLGTNREATPARKSFATAFIRESFARSQERLKREVLDVVLLHNPSERSLLRGEASGVLEEMKTTGALRAWGVSVGSTATAREAIKQGAQVLELAYNAFHSRTLRELDTEIREKGLAVLARSVLAHGLLCGQWPTNKEFASGDHRAERWTSDDLKRRISQLNALRPCVAGSVTSLRAAALRFVLANERVSSAVLGPRGALQLDQLLRDAGKEPPYLSPESLSALDLRLANVGVSA
ncbi:MAG TPA: aldo/keto reductase [Polyangiaceae bacterium]|jgi:aryl-alcohol dehydrogenase-like predicted oxidoreductase|nr:aldo/keto reductase [Polyangiaceae bacterium]